MSESTITAKGQTTVRLVWHVMPDGSLIVRAKTLSILDLAGTLKAPAGKKVSIEDMNAWR